MKELASRYKHMKERCKIEHAYLETELRGESERVMDRERGVTDLAGVTLH